MDEVRGEPDELEGLTLDQVQALLEEENRLWAEKQIGLNPIDMRALPSMLLDMQAKLQALTNAVILAGSVDEYTLNLEYKKILLRDMRAIRASVPKADSDRLRRQILDGIHTPSLKPPWEN